MSRQLPDTAILLSSLRGNVCPCCGGRKRPNTSLCFAGYGTLSRDQKNALYNRFGEGYEQALEIALDIIKPGGARFWPEPKPVRTAGCRIVGGEGEPDYGGTVGADGNVYSDADPGL